MCMDFLDGELMNSCNCFFCVYEVFVVFVYLDDEFFGFGVVLGDFMV